MMEGRGVGRRYCVSRTLHVGGGISVWCDVVEVLEEEVVVAWPLRCQDQLGHIHSNASQTRRSARVLDVECRVFLASIVVLGS